jgi:hypothetical protein
MPPLQCRAKRNGMLRAEFTALNWIRFLPRALAAAFDSDESSPIRQLLPSTQRERTHSFTPALPRLTLTEQGRVI